MSQESSFFFEEPSSEKEIYTIPDTETRDEQTILEDLKKLGTEHAKAVIRGDLSKLANVLRRVVGMGVRGEIKEMKPEKGGKYIREFNGAATKIAASTKLDPDKVRPKALAELQQGFSFWRGAESVVQAAKFLNEDFKQNIAPEHPNFEHALGINVYLDTKHQVDVVDMVFDPNENIIKTLQMVQVKSQFSAVDPSKVVAAHQLVLDSVFRGEKIISIDEQRKRGLEKLQALATPFFTILSDYAKKKSKNPEMKPNVGKMIEAYSSACGISLVTLVNALKNPEHYKKFENVIYTELTLVDDTELENNGLELLEKCASWIKEQPTTPSPSPVLVPINKAYSVIMEGGLRKTFVPLTLPPRGSHLILLR